MTIVAANWVGENTSTVGTGPLALSGAISTFCPFSVLPDGSEVYYTLQEGFNRETGIGVVSNGTLTRKVQATLVAGVYTETDIPISLSGNGQVFAVINADFMTRIYNFSLDVADSVAAAAASAQAAADSAALANDYETQSAQNAEDAAASALSASDSKVAADASKNDAASSASAAASSQADALASKNASAASEANSKSSANASAQYATNASNSAAAALASKTAAKTSEDNALASKTAAKTSETNAKTSETNAKTSEINAKASETAANSAKKDAQTANLQTQSLYNQTVNLVAGVQAPDKLPTSPSGSRSWMKIANIKSAGDRYAFVQFIIGGGSNYGAANVPVDIFSLSGRGLPDTLTSNNIDANFTQRTLIAASPSDTRRINLGVVKNTDSSFDVYLHALNGWIPELWLSRVNVQANNGSITGPIINHAGYSWITTEPAGIVYNSPSDYLMSNDRTIPRTNVANTFSQPQVISSTLTLGANATDSMHAVGLQQVKKLIPADPTVVGALQRSGGTMSGGIVMDGNTIAKSGKIDFSSPSNAYQTLSNMGVMASPERLVIPISATQAWCMQSGTTILTFDSSGEATLSYPMAFATLNTFVCVNGDAEVTNRDFVDSLVPFNTSSSKTSLRNRRITGGGSVTWIHGIYRVNWVATGLINI